MRYIEEDGSLGFKFTTRQFSTGAPFTLAGTPSLAVYPKGSLTQITAGITLTVDYDGKTGCNDVVIDLSASASYAADNCYQVVIEAGTVDSVSVVGEVIYEFFIVAAGAMEDIITRGLLALPNSAPDAAGGLPVSDAGGLDLDAKLANTNEITAARMGALTDWIDGGRLDLLLDAIKAVTDNLPDSGALSTLTGYVDDLETRLTATRAGYLDNLNGHTPQTGDVFSQLPTNFPSMAITGAGGVQLADGVTHGGTSAKLRLGSSNSTPALYVTNTDTGLASHAVHIRAGNGTLGGVGMLVQSGGDVTAGFLMAHAGGIYAGTGNLATAASISNLQTYGDSNWATATGFSTLDAAGVRTAVGLASDNLDAQLSAIVTDTNELQTDWTNGGRLDLLVDAILEDTGTTLPGTLSTISTNVSQTLADTNELQTDWADGGRLDLILDAASSGSGDWTTTEKNEIRYRLGIDGTTSAPSSNSPNLGIAGAAGSGADSVTLTILHEITGLPIADADVWISTDVNGSNVVAGTLQTNSSGEVTFMLDAGETYYCWRQKDGINFDNPQSFTAVAD